MNTEEMVVEAARKYARALLDVESTGAAIEDAGMGIGQDRQSWLVRMNGSRTSVIVAVEVERDGRCEARHHVRLAA